MESLSILRKGRVWCLFYYFVTDQKYLHRWTFPTFKKGMHKELDEEDLFGPLQSHRSHVLGQRLEEEWMKEVKNENPPLLYRALFRTFGPEIIFHGVTITFVDSLGLLQPYLVGRMISVYMTDETKPTTDRKAYLLLLAIVVVNFSRVILNHTYELSVKHLGMKIRIACSSLIYRKSLKLCKGSHTGSTIGQMINLLSNDAARFDQVMLNIHRFWLTPIEAIAMMTFFYFSFGFITLFGCLFFIIVLVPIQILIGYKFSVYRYKMAIRTDERVRWMSIMINKMKVIKMYSLESAITNLVKSVRKSEMRCLQQRFYLRCALFTFIIISRRFCTFIVIVANVLIADKPTAMYFTICAGFHTVFTRMLMQFTVFGIPQVVETWISIRRISTFLLLEETSAHTTVSRNVTKSTVRIRLQNATAKWPGSAGSENTLTDINLVIRDNCLIALIGEVGCGKSSLIKLIMKELPLLEGSCVVNGHLSYASQEPWLLHASIKENILLGQPMNRRRYLEVLMVCLLHKDLARFEYGDRTLVGVRGTNLNIGQKFRIALARAFYRDADIYLFDYPFTVIDQNTSMEIFERGMLKLLRGKCIIVATQRVQFLSKVDKIILLNKGRVEMFRTFLQMQRTVYDIGKIMVVVKESEDEDVEMDEVGPVKLEKEQKAQKEQETRVEDDGAGETKETKRGGKVTKIIYRTYIKCGATWSWFLVIVAIFAIAQIFATGSDYWVPYWLSWEQRRGPDVPYSKLHLNIYAALIAMLIVTTILRNIIFYRFCIRASTNLHNEAFHNVIHGKMSFFTLNPSGRILNRFSRDMGGVDEVLPNLMMESLQIALDVFGICIVVSIVTSWALGVTILLLVALYCFRKMYLRTSRNLKRLEAINRSPVLTHLNSTMHGLNTIRAFEAQDMMIRRFDDRQDMHSSAFFMLMSCNQAFSLWVDLQSVIYISIVLFSYLYMGTEHYGSKLVTHLVTMSGLLNIGMIRWAETENLMTSVERIVEYMEIEHETDPRHAQVPEKWPERGTIEFKNVYMKHSDNSPYVLRNVSFKIEDCEKVAIIGKTGHGKSSLILCLFMLTDFEGDITVDDVNVNQIPLQKLRSKITVIPQEPVLFAGTIRENVDPLNIYEDVQIWNVLEKVHLKEAVSKLEFGLDTEVAEGGVNFTIGQRHLFCLAKAILYKSKILILDDVTANIDSNTERFIDDAIQTNFQDCTVVIIKHNITNVSNFDKIIYIEHGQVVECDHPLVLLKKKGQFYRLFTGTGQSQNSSPTANYIKLGYSFRF